MDELFGNPEDERAYNAFVEEQERAGQEGFSLSEPALVCRWRMANRQVPLLNRHIRALAQRAVRGEPLTRNMLAWAKQHVEWSLAEGAYDDPNGVLMLVVDVDGNAAMTVGGYRPLERPDAVALARRAQTARAEQAETGVAPELLCAADAGALVVAAGEGEALPGVGTLVEQLARTRGMDVVRDGAWAAALRAGGAEAARADAFLVSDEHGVVLPGLGEPGGLGGFLREGYERLRASCR